MKMIEWIEPFDHNNEPVYMLVERATAIAYQRQKHDYESDELALEDFMIVNMAYEVEM